MRHGAHGLPAIYPLHHSITSRDSLGFLIDTALASIKQSKQDPLATRNRLVLAAACLALSLQPLGAGAQSNAGQSNAGQPMAGQSADQNQALTAVSKMMEGQRTYYQKNGRFQATVSTVQRDFGFTLPTSFSFAIRTTTYSAYSYVIPNQPAYTGQLKAYVGATFMTPGQNPKMITIICQNTQPGQIRPADPSLVLGSFTLNPTGSIVQCGNFSTQISASVVNE
jgi:hypothetical protein